MLPAAVAGLTNVLAQLDDQQIFPSLTVTIVVDVIGYKRSLTSRNGVWDGYDLTHQFQDDRSTAINGPSSHTLFEEEVSLLMLPCVASVQAVAPELPLVAIQPYHPHQQQTMPTLALMTPNRYPCSPAFGAPHMLP